MITVPYLRRHLRCLFFTAQAVAVFKADKIKMRPLRLNANIALQLLQLACCYLLATELNTSGFCLRFPQCLILSFLKDKIQFLCHFKSMTLALPPSRLITWSFTWTAQVVGIELSDSRRRHVHATGTPSSPATRTGYNVCMCIQKKM